MEFSKYFDYPPPGPFPPELNSTVAVKTEPDLLPHPPIMHNHTTPPIKQEPPFEMQNYVHGNPYYAQPLGWWASNPNAYNPLKYCPPAHPPNHSNLFGHGHYVQPYEQQASGFHQEHTSSYSSDPKSSHGGGGKIKSKSSKTSSHKSPKKSKVSPKKEKQEGAKPATRKKIDRFDGLPEEEIARKLLPDHLDHNLDILIIGINPGLYAAHKGHHYAGPGNHFWKCLFLSGLVTEPYTSDDDYKMLEQRIGFTNMVARTTRGSADLSRTELKEGCEILISKLRYYQPKIAVFNGKGIYEVFSGKKDFYFGKQPEKIEGTNIVIWVMPSSSARCAQLPRAVDKVPFYAALKKLRDYINGQIPHLDESEITFSELRLKNAKSPTKVKKEEPQENNVQ